MALDLVDCDTVGWLIVTRKIVSEMTYNVSNGMLNTTIPYTQRNVYEQLAQHCKGDNGTTGSRTNNVFNSVQFISVAGSQLMDKRGTKIHVATYAISLISSVI